MKSTTFIPTVLAIFTMLAGLPARADNMASIAIAPTTGVVALTPRWSIGGGLAGFHLMAQDLSLGGGPNQFYSIKGAAIPSGGDTAAFTRYIAASGAATNHTDIGSKLTPNAYSALTSADPDLGYGAVNLYVIHHKSSGDYFTAIVPSSGTASAVTDLKPMSGPGGPATLGASGYFGLTFAAANLSYGLNKFYYLRTDAVTGFTKFGALDPALLGTSADKFDLGLGGHNALAFTGTDVGFGTDKMYYLRLDAVTGFTILGTLHPVTGKTADIANLGSVYSTLTFVPGDVGFGTGLFYTAGSVNTAGQTVSFAAIADRLIGAGAFTVAPSASSGLPITLTVVSGSTGAASISGPVAGVFTVTPTAPGVITLQATQAGQLAPTAYEFNELRQSFTASGATLLKVTAQPTPQTVVAGGTANFSVTASGTSTVSYQWRKDAAAITGNASASTAVLTLSNVQATNAGSYDVIVTNASGSLSSAPVLLVVTTADSPAPAIVTQPVPQTLNSGDFATFTVVASGTPTPTYQWLLDGQPILGATGPTLTLANTTVDDNGAYSVTITNSSGSVTTSPVALHVRWSRIVNFSARALSGPGDQTLIMGFVISGGEKHLLVRGVGPTLASFGIVNPLADPFLTLFGTQGAVATNNDWGTDSNGQPVGTAIAATASRVGAFPLPNGSKDAALLFTVGDGVHTTSLLRPNSTTGVALVEVYDTDDDLAARLINVSARMNVSTGENVLIAGFVISGDAPKTVLIRGIGPSLTPLGVGGVLGDPAIAVYAGSSLVATNDNWSTGSSTPADIVAVSARVGAFALPASSKDAALLLTLQPGSYSVHVSGAGNTTGVALVEVYDTQ